MFLQKIEWSKAKELYGRGIITKIELANAGIDYINDAPTKDIGYLRAAEVDVMMEGCLS